MCFSSISFSYSSGIPNCHNICLFVACFLSYSGGFSDRCNRPSNCPDTFLVQFFPSIFFSVPSPKPITLASNLFIFLSVCLPLKKKKKNTHTHILSHSQNLSSLSKPSDRSSHHCHTSSSPRIFTAMHPHSQNLTWVSLY